MSAPAYDINGTKGRSLFHLVPPGIILAFGGTRPPTSWLLCDGVAYSSSAYPDLYNAIGTTFGSGGSGTFRVPDMRNRFARGWSSQRPIGVSEEDKIKGHEHRIISDNTTSSTKFLTNDFNDVRFESAELSSGNKLLYGPVAENIELSATSAGDAEFDDESRPQNVTLQYIIRYRPSV